MVTALSQFSAHDLAQASAQSPACARYLSLLKLPQSPSIAGTLRFKRHTAWLTAALNALQTRASAATICEYWSEQTDLIVRDAWTAAGLDQFAVALFALGKWGAQELNLSSDIDFIVVSQHPADQEIAKAFRIFHSLLAENSEMGFCYRLDLDLRPGGRLGPLISSLSQLEDYYWSQGATWERLALIRLRPIVGDQGVMTAVQVLAKKFSFRRFLDYTLLDEIKTLRSQILSFYEVADANSVNLKLGEGGIRDIELYVHSLLVIHGGKNPSLQTRSTTNALEGLAKCHLLKDTEAKFLQESYWRLRDLENKLQAVNDQQTHILLGPSEDLKKNMRAIDEFVSTLLGESSGPQPTLALNLIEQETWLKTLGFSEHSIAEVWPQLMQTTAQSLRSDLDERARQQFLYLFITELAQHGFDRDLGLQVLLEFVRAIRAKATFFTLFVRETRLIRDLALLFSTSPYLGNILASRPELVDNFLVRSQEQLSHDIDSLVEQLIERRLLNEIIVANQFLRDQKVVPLARNLSDTADEISTTLLQHLTQELGPSSLQIMALGKWGGRELGLKSDLDFIFVTPSEPVEPDYKIAKRFISRMTDPRKGGVLFSIDTRLRPSGSRGPLLVSIDRLRNYLAQEAQPWERQSYLKARTFQPLPFDLPALLMAKKLSAEDLNQLADIRRQLLKPADDAFLDLKFESGAMVDIEFAVQIALLQTQEICRSTNTLEQLEHLQTRDAKWKKTGPDLAEIYLSFRQVEQLNQLLTNHAGSQVRVKADETERLIRLLKTSEDALFSSLRHRLSLAKEILNELDPIYSSR